jgi:threonine-phosphate decarboxylase
MASISVSHGGRALAFALARNVDCGEVVDFSANINPLGPAPLVISALRNSLETVQVYPDESASRLVSRLSNELHVSAEHILAGNGATDLLYFFIRSIRPETASLIVPTFTEYRRALAGCRTAIDIVTLKPDDLYRLPNLETSNDLVILTNPNNPTGTYTPPDLLCEWIQHIPASTQILLDEAFVEFTAGPSMVHETMRFPNLWVLRSMTKFYAIPGLRLGYLVGCGVPSIMQFREPWQVNNLAEIAGLASLDDRDHSHATLEYIQRERIWFWTELQQLRRVHAAQTDANFFLARCDSDAMLDRLIVTLAEENVLIRDCRDVEGLNGPYFRFAIKTHAENLRLLNHLRNI